MDLNTAIKLLKSEKCPKELKLNLDQEILNKDSIRNLAEALQSGACINAKIMIDFGCHDIKAKGIIAMIKALKSKKCPQRLSLDFSKSDIDSHLRGLPYFNGMFLKCIGPEQLEIQFPNPKNPEEKEELDITKKLFKMSKLKRATHHYLHLILASHSSQDSKISNLFGKMHQSLPIRDCMLRFFTHQNISPKEMNEVFKITDRVKNKIVENSARFFTTKKQVGNIFAVHKNVLIKKKRLREVKNNI